MRNSYQIAAKDGDGLRVRNGKKSSVREMWNSKFVSARSITYSIFLARLLCGQAMHLLCVRVAFLQRCYLTLLIPVMSLITLVC